LFKKIKWILLAIFLPVAEVATVLLVHRFIGLWLTLLLVVISSSIGLFLWVRHSKKLNEIVLENEKLYGKDVKDYPANVAMIHMRDAFGAMVALICFLSPGFLSDIIGYLTVSSSSFLNWYAKRSDKDLSELAELHGVTWGQYCDKMKENVSENNEA